MAAGGPKSTRVLAAPAATSPGRISGPLLFHAPAGDRIQRGRTERLARAEAEARVMPRTAHRVTDHEPLHERPAVVRTLRPDGEQFAARPREYHLVVTHAPEDQAPISQGRGGNPFRQVDGCVLLRLAHGRLRAAARRNMNGSNLLETGCRARPMRTHRPTIHIARSRSIRRSQDHRSLSRLCASPGANGPDRPDRLNGKRASPIASASRPPSTGGPYPFQR